MFYTKKIREINSQLLHEAFKWRIIPFNYNGSKGYLIEGYIQKDVTEGKWFPLKGTFIPYSTEHYNSFGKNMEYAYNRCKKLARKFPEIKINKLICESGYASWKYGSIDGPGYIPCYSENDIY